jgi:hypothetical protein
VSVLTDFLGTIPLGHIIAVVTALVSTAIVFYAVRKSRETKRATELAGLSAEELKAVAEDYYRRAAQTADPVMVREYLDRGDAHLKLSELRVPKGQGRRAARD